MSRIATRRDLLLLTGVALVALLCSFGLRWALVDDASSWDVPLYESFGDRIADGAVPYRDLRIEYPPGALPAFVLPALASRAFGPSGPSVYEPALNAPARSYALWFGLGMIGCLALAVVATALTLASLRASIGHAALALATVALVPLLLGELSFTRFDALPMALTALALAALLRSRPLLTGVLLGLATATKLYPVLLLPLAAVFAAVHLGSRAGVRLAAACVVTAVAVFAPFVALAPSEALFPVRAQLDRGLQVESLPGSLVLAADGFLERTASQSIVSIDEGGTGAVRSADVVGVAGTLASFLCLVALAALVLRVWLRWSRPPFPMPVLVAACATVLTAQLALGRVLSPQFTLWALPFVPLVAGRRGRVATGLLVAALVVTGIWFPTFYREFVNGQDPGATLVLLARNGLLVALVLVLLGVVERRPRVLTRQR